MIPPKQIKLLYKSIKSVYISFPDDLLTLFFSLTALFIYILSLCILLFLLKSLTILTYEKEMRSHYLASTYPNEQMHFSVRSHIYHGIVHIQFLLMLPLYSFDFPILPSNVAPTNLLVFLLSFEFPYTRKYSICTYTKHLSNSLSVFPRFLHQI